MGCCRGAQILDELFPGLLAGLAADGAPVLRAPREFRFFVGGHVLCQGGGEPGEPSYVQSRPFLEAMSATGSGHCATCRSGTGLR